ncbi:glycosyltransferase family 4 protein [Staphylococcus equorum]|uniref:glycosyltransferase family 4 protein n=3 Tax=Staphylococcus equorum TaxID=246432 RepID=UPI002DB7B261|nr:glycosyltransferase family 4 protein [Staphylococcus equorum]MEB7673062.1 glycosyltransferase family 4 protein [Staphylococcus equorum]
MKIIQIAAIEMTHIKLLKTLNESSVAQGFEVHCVSTFGTQQNEVENQGVYYHNIKIDRKINPINNVNSILQMVKLFKKINPDIVHVHTPVAAVLGRIAAKIAGVPTIIYTAHGFYFHEGMSLRKYQFYFNVEKLIGRYFTDYIFTQSEEDYHTAVQYKFLKASKKDNYLHISNGIDMDREFNIELIDPGKTKQLKQKLNIKSNDIVVSFIGRLVKEKGILDLLESYDKLVSENVKFIIIGDLPESERDNETVKLISKYRKEENIIFTGQITNINEYLAISDIYCLPSYREGMPRSIIEAMSMKNAVIATDIRGSREEVINNETGYLVPLQASMYIANKIDELVNDKNKLNKFKESGYIRAKKNYNEINVVQKQLDIFNKVKY